MLGSFHLRNREIESEDKKPKKSHHKKIHQIIIKFPEYVLDLLLLMSDDIFGKFSEEIIERFFAKHPVKFSSGLVSKFLKQRKIDVGGNVVVPAIAAYKIILLSYAKNKDRNLGFLIIRNHLHRIISYIRIAVGDQNHDSRFICFLISELLEIFSAEKKRVTDSRSQEILDRREIAEIHLL